MPEKITRKLVIEINILITLIIFFFVDLRMQKLTIASLYYMRNNLFRAHVKDNIYRSFSSYIYDAQYIFHMKLFKHYCVQIDKVHNYSVTFIFMY